MIILMEHLLCKIYYVKSINVDVIEHNRIIHIDSTKTN